METISVGVSVRAGVLLVGLDPYGNRHLLIPMLPGEAVSTDIRGSSVHLVRVESGGGTYLSVVCLTNTLHGVFSRFARELVSTIADESSPARGAASAYRRWRSLFDDETATRLSTDQLVGLIGELTSVGELLRHGACPDLSWWTGPRSQQHDVRSPAFALEIKSSLVREGREVTIHGVDQLATPGSGAGLFLVHHQFDREPAGSNLGSVVAVVEQAGAETDALRYLLNRVGVTEADLEPVSPRRFRHVATRIYDVERPHFPRITRVQFVGGELPPGTMRLTYGVDLTNEPPHPLDAASMEHLSSRLAANTLDGAVG